MPGGGHGTCTEKPCAYSIITSFSKGKTIGLHVVWFWGKFSSFRKQPWRLQSCIFEFQAQTKSVEALKQTPGGHPAKPA
jgi:hypothetical protein